MKIKDMSNEIMEVQFLPTITEMSLKKVKYEILFIILNLRFDLLK